LRPEGFAAPLSEKIRATSSATDVGERDIGELRTDPGKFRPVAGVLRAARASVIETWHVTRE
jgi:hypothetical protein